MKICLECAEGGHMEQMLSLVDAFEGNDVFILTAKTKATKNLPFRTYFVHRLSNKLINNIGGQFIGILINSFIVIKLILKENPNLIISLNGSATIPLFYLTKIIGVKSVYIESLSRVNELSKTGRIVYPITDLFLVQWENLTKKYPKAKYWGSIL